jgi:hypothetical protein
VVFAGVLGCSQEEKPADPPKTPVKADAGTETSTGSAGGDLQLNPNYKGK